MSLDSDHLPEVREQYERLPYPPCDPEDDNRRLVTTWLDDLPMVNHCGDQHLVVGPGFAHRQLVGKARVLLGRCLLYTSDAADE